MPRLLVHVEGQTEETFVNQVLGPHLYDYGYLTISARLLGNARQRHRRGGMRPWEQVRRDIANHLNEDPRAIATTMVDYYGLPKMGSSAWPGRNSAPCLAFPQNARAVETALLADISQHMGNGFNPGRFIPYVQMHEFEALLFSDCEQFALGIGRSDLAPCFQMIRNAVNSPEEIDDSPLTAPSKRVEELMPGYQKPLTGLRAVQKIGLDTIRAECLHFNDWLQRLECLPSLGGTFTTQEA